MDNETIDQCIDRIKKAGYFPIRRIEKPIFEEVMKEGEVHYQPIGKKIVFDAIVNKDEQ
ncbi:NETI motif-containing protein [Amphibacillus cookii]|uniref:NETI motif-containing protein n=1 Tax=Amphibacillus cookii TaxID=767787 RepID=UPI00195C9C40|nr:NETI motif-containing protein [Amphibacillus cookii]MBM7542199.1 thiol-disulfide isomerase/thioredoxin [Amphibacillus cookii]